jgi:uncharacterized integral membrane protein
VQFCTDCHCELIEQLVTPDDASVIFGEKEFIEEINAFLKYNNLPGGDVRESEDDDTYELFIKNKYLNDSKKIIRIYLQEKALEQIEAEENGERPKAINKKAYQDKKERAAEVKSSAYTLTVVGIIGIIFVILMELNVLTLPISTFSKHMTAIVMGILFLVFTVMGILSFRSLKKIIKEGNKESNLTAEMKRWCGTNLDGKQIDEEVFDLESEYQDEIKYFMRTEEIKQLISNQFLNLEEGFLDKFVEEVYVEIYQNED